MIEIILFLGICFFGWGDCPEPIVEEYVLLIDDFAFKGYDWKVTDTEFRQGIIGEVINNSITFASGNHYFLKSLDQELEAGQIITIRMDHYESSCKLSRVSLNNATTYYNIKDKDNFELVDDDRFKTSEELDFIQKSYSFSEILWWKFSGDINPTTLCFGYEKYFLESIDGKLAEELPIGELN